MLIILKALNQMQQITGMRLINICILYCSYLRFFILNKLLFSPVQSLDHVLQ